MKLTKKQEKEVMQVHEAYWAEYLKGNVIAMVSLLDDSYTQVGSAEGEVFSTKKEAVQFLVDTIGEVAGKLEMRNRDTKLEQQGTLILIHELCDLYAITDGEWVFYSKFRASTLLKETLQGWKIAHQHSSFPDTKTEKGQNVAIDRIAEENLELREAVKRRTVELEQKNRELQIEAALERVRAKTMAMQSSEELQDTALLLFQQVEGLGVPPFACGFNIWDNDGKAATAWMGSLAGLQPPFKTDSGKDIYLPIRSAAQRGESLLVLEQAGEDLAAHYAYLATIPTFRDIILKNVEREGISIPTFQIIHCAFFSQGYLMFISYEPVTAFHEVFKRFATVFEQTYTRFLDLQKAEAQTREATIEAALEKVRSRSMAMHQSTDMLAVADVLFQQLRSLGGNLWGSGVVICKTDVDDDEIWFANEKGVLPPIALPHTEDPTHKQMYDGWSNNMGLISITKEGPELKAHYDYMLSVPSVSPLFENILSSGLSFPEKQTWYAASFSFGYILTITLDPYPEEQILIRFAKVFEQTYTRFLDLQKAEVQAWEAQVEAALERVRAKAMAMHTSEDLWAVTGVLRAQMALLGEKELESIIIHIYDSKPDEFEAWYSFSRPEDPEGKIIDGKAVIKWANTARTLADRKKYLEKETDYTIVADRKMLKEWYDYLDEVAPMVVERDDRGAIIVPEVLYYNYSKFSGGALLLITSDKAMEHSKNLLKRSAEVFNMAFTRFLDLQKAEAQAREAQIEAALERVRAKSMAMHKSEELAKLSLELVKQVQDLGVATWFCAFNIYDDDPLGSMEWGSNGQGTFPRYRTPREGIFLRYFEAGKGGETLLIHEIGENECAAHYDYLCTLPGVGEQLLQMKEAGISFPRSQIDHVAFFKYGYILFITYEHVPESHDIFKRFAKVFEQTYTRFLDLQKAEALAKQAQIDLENLIAAKKKTDEALTELKATQSQLIQSEKMASLGELTAGIAHEIQNPLNFVNNFSEVSNELIDEMKEELDKGDIEEAKAISEDIKQNLEKINHHGKRADAIVKGMLQHSRSSSGTKAPTDLNALCDEYLRLAYHGLRAKDKSFNATLNTDFDPSIGTVDIVPQDMGRVILNLITNAFYAVTEKKNGPQPHESGATYEPTVWVSTKTHKGQVTIGVKDNGNGIPEKVKEKIFQPFFTTKPTGQGTGLGLSLSYDIVKAHGGTLQCNTTENTGTEFVIELPLN